MKRSLTRATFSKLTNELKEREETTRREIAGQIRTAKEFGDLSENAAYKDARDAEGKNESRILYLKNILKNAVQLPQNQKRGDRASIGATVKLKRLSDEESVTYRIVDSEEADPINGLISDSAPIGRALLGQKVGAKVEVATPRGKLAFKILSID